jgi:hypothetical protein
MTINPSFVDYLARLLLILAVAGTAVLAGTTAQAAEFAVSPMLIELDAAPDTAVPIRFNVFGKSAGRARIRLAGMQQQATGHMRFLPQTPDVGGLASWITLDRDALNLRREETATVEGRIAVPRRTPAGTYLAALLVEEDDDGRKTGIVLNVRYAIIVSVRIAGAQSRIATQFSDLRLEEQGERTFVAASFRNDGTRDDMLDAELQLRDATNRLVHRTPLKSQSAWQRADAGSRVFPGADVVVFGELPATLPAGDYQATVRNRFGGRSQPVQRATLNLPAGRFVAPASTESRPVRIPDTDATAAIPSTGAAPAL